MLSKRKFVLESFLNVFSWFAYFELSSDSRFKRQMNIVSGFFEKTWKSFIYKINCTSLFMNLTSCIRFTSGMNKTMIKLFVQTPQTSKTFFVLKVNFLTRDNNVSDDFMQSNQRLFLYLAVWNEFLITEEIPQVAWSVVSVNIEVWWLNKEFLFW